TPTPGIMPPTRKRRPEYGPSLPWRSPNRSLVPGCPRDPGSGSAGFPVVTRGTFRGLDFSHQSRYSASAQKALGISRPEGAGAATPGMGRTNAPPGGGGGTGGAPGGGTPITLPPGGGGGTGGGPTAWVGTIGGARAAGAGGRKG